MLRSGRFPRHMRWQSSGGLAAALLGAETQGLAIDFTDLSMVIRDTGTPANVFSGDPNSKLTYSSPSTKWVLGANGLYSSGTTLRTSYNASGTALGVLIEEARTNLAKQSTFQSGYDTSAASVLTLNAATSPDGTSNAATLIPDSTNAQHWVRNNNGTSVTAGSTYTCSFFVKKIGSLNILLNVDPDNTFNIAQTAVFDLSSGTVSQVGSSMTSASIVALPNSWYRVSVTYVAPLTTTGTPIIYGCLSVASRVFTGDSASGWAAWGNQVELGAFATSPIVTAGSTVTRAADNISGIDLVSWLTGTRTALQVTSAMSYVAGMTSVLSIGNSASGEQSRSEMYMSDAVTMTALMRNVSGSTINSNGQTVTSLSPGRAYKAAYTYATDDMITCVDGVLGTADVTGTIGNNANKIWIGRAYSQMSGVVYIAKAMVIPRRMSNAELQTVTT